MKRLWALYFSEKRKPGAEEVPREMTTLWQLVPQPMPLGDLFEEAGLMIRAYILYLVAPRELLSLCSQQAGIGMLLHVCDWSVISQAFPEVSV